LQGFAGNVILIKSHPRKTTPFTGTRKVEGIRNILIHTLLCIIAMLLVALTAIKLGKPEQITAITSLT
jgi:hypothetical protein